MELAHDVDAPEVLAPARVPLFCDSALAGRIERAEADLITRCCEAARRRAGAEGFVIPVAGGGYQLESFENVLGRDPGPCAPTSPGPG